MRYPRRAADEGRTLSLIDTSQLAIKEPRAGWRGRFFHSDNMTFAYYTVEAGASIHEHSHENDEVWNVIEGTLEVTIEGQTHVATPGCAAVVAPNARHSITALTAARTIVVDHPVRRSIGGVDL